MHPDDLPQLASEARADETRRPNWFQPAELARVLSRYGLGVIHSVEPYDGGSPLAPKAVVESELGRHLLKRREPIHGDPYRVAVCHDVQLRLGSAGFPVAPLLGTTDDNNSMCQLDGRVYELFGFVEGKRSGRDETSAGRAGACLARMHSALRGYEPEWEPAKETYHAAPWVASRFRAARSKLGSEAGGAIDRLEAAYAEAADLVDSAGLADQQPHMVHGDWHPGNLLVERGSIAAVVDFDTARFAPGLVDVARGAVNFALERDEAGGLRLDPPRFAAFCDAYEHASGGDAGVGSDAMPGLVTESVIVEAIEPVAATGTFGEEPGGRFVQMVADRLESFASVARRAG